MNTIKTIAKNTGMLLVAQIISYVFGFFFIIYAARYFGAEGFGILSFALAFTGIFGVFADFGLSTLTVRDVARDKIAVKKYLGNITLIKTILVIITFGLIALSINLLDYPKKTIIIVYLIALAVITASFTQMFYSVFQAFEKMEYISYGKILNSVLLLVGIFIAMMQAFDLTGFAFMYFLVSAIVLGYSFIVSAYKFVTPSVEADWNFWRRIIKEALPFFLSAFFSLIAFRIDMIMLSIIKGDLVVGWYSAAYRLMEILIFIPSTYVASIYPQLSVFHISSQKSLILLYQKSFKYLVILGLPIAVGTTILADKIILMVYGNEFAKSIIGLQILIWTIPVIFLTYMFGTMLASINRQNLILKTLFICMLINIGLNLILIPEYGYIGASIATVFTEIIGFILQFYSLSKYVHKLEVHELIAKPVLASTVMCLVILFFVKINILFLICLSSLIYFYTLIILKTFSAEDYDLFKQIINIKRNGVEG